MSWYGNGSGSWGMWPRYISVAERRRNAEQAAARLERSGRTLHPVTIQGRAVAKTFWGKAWCDNLMSYSDYENRLPRGLSYLRNGSVIDLDVREGLVEALVSGTDVYEVRIEIRSVARARWAAIKRQCAGQIGSLVDLLRGKLSAKVMAIIARPGDGLFPAPAAMTMTCSCPDWAAMCKHVAAVLYGIGARLDEQPELLFVLRKVDHLQLIAEAPAAAVGKSRGRASKATAADTARLGAVFGIELAEEAVAAVQPQKRRTVAKSRMSPEAAKARKTRTSREVEKPKPAKRRVAKGMVAEPKTPKGKPRKLPER